MNLIEVVYSDGRLFCLCDEALVILDVSDPLAPKELSRLPLSFCGQSLVVQNGFSYIASIDRIHAVDVSDSLKPRIIAECPLWGNFRFICIGRNLLCILETVSITTYYYDKVLSPSVRFEVLDISEPAELYPIGFCDVPSEYFGQTFVRLHIEEGTELMVLFGNHLLVGGYGLYNLKRPFAPNLINVLRGRLRYEHCRFLGDYLIGIYEEDGICVNLIEASDPRNLSAKGCLRVCMPRRLRRWNAAVSRGRLLINWDATVYGEYVESTHYCYGLTEISTTNPLKPEVVRELETDTWLGRPISIGPYLCTFDGSSVCLYDLDCPGSLKELWRLSFE